MPSAAAHRRPITEIARVARQAPLTTLRYITFEAAIAEAQHELENHLTAIRALRKLVARMDIVAVANALIQPVFNEVEQWAPRMDFADACAVVLARNYERAFVLTTDFRDFSAYRVPFASPEGAFHV
jgi:predicted nucleic acid-binding protein